MGLRKVIGISVVALLLMQPCAVWAGADSSGQALSKEIDELERRLDILSAELRKLREAQVLPEQTELTSHHGLGPAASKVYDSPGGVSIGGYGEFSYKNETDGGNDDQFDFTRMVLYFGYKFNDWVIFNSEIEFEHASTEANDQDGSVSVEFAHLDLLLHKNANLRAGLMLVPMGFINELHEPPFFHGNDRPAVERQIIPTTWRANGVGVFGEIVPGLSYRTYLVSSLRAARFSSANFRSGRQDGNREKADDFSWIGRLDYSPSPGLDFTVSAYLGDQGQGDKISFTDSASGLQVLRSVDAFLQIYEAHVQWRYHGLELRGLGVVTDLENARELSENAASVGKGPIAKRSYGWYAELAYDVMPLLKPASDQYLAPWLRYSRYDTQERVPAGFTPDAAADREDVEFGLTYKPVSRVVIKLDYRIRDAKGASRPDTLRLGAGFVF